MQRNQTGGNGCEIIRRVMVAAGPIGKNAKKSAGGLVRGYRQARGGED